MLLRLARGPELPAVRSRRAGRPGLHRGDAAADGLFGRRCKGLWRQGYRRADRMARIAENPVDVCAHDPRRDLRLVDRAGAGAADGRAVRLARRVQADVGQGNARPAAPGRRSPRWSPGRSAARCSTRCRWATASTAGWSRRGSRKR